MVPLSSLDKREDEELGEKVNKLSRTGTEDTEERTSARCVATISAGGLLPALLWSNLDKLYRWRNLTGNSSKSCKLTVKYGVCEQIKLPRVQKGFFKSQSPSASEKLPPFNGIEWWTKCSSLCALRLCFILLVLLIPPRLPNLSPTFHFLYFTFQKIMIIRNLTLRLSMDLQHVEQNFSI